MANGTGMDPLETLFQNVQAGGLPDMRQQVVPAAQPAVTPQVDPGFPADQAAITSEQPPIADPAVEEPEIDAADLLDTDDDLGIPPDLMQALRDQAKGGMSTQEAIGLASLAMANPQMATMLISQRAQGAGNARATLAKLAQQSALTQREGAKNRAALERATLGAETRDKVARINQNTALVGRTNEFIREAELKDAPLAPDDLSDTAAVNKWHLNIQEKAGPIWREKFVREEMAKAFIRGEELATRGVDPETQIRRELTAQGLTDEEMGGPLFDAEIQKQAGRAKKKQRAALAGVTRGARNIEMQNNLAQARIDQIRNSIAEGKIKLSQDLLDSHIRGIESFQKMSMQYSADALAWEQLDFTEAAEGYREISQQAAEVANSMQTQMLPIRAQIIESVERGATDSTEAIMYAHTEAVAVVLADPLVMEQIPNEFLNDQEGMFKFLRDPDYINHPIAKAIREQTMHNLSRSMGIDFEGARRMYRGALMDIKFPVAMLTDPPPADTATEGQQPYGYAPGQHIEPE